VRIRSFHIDGFGIFHNQGIQNIPEGFIIFIGKNESGKTTLMEFIRTMLFGFPRRGSRNDYPPLRGGNHGGRLQVVMQDGRQFTIERARRNIAIMEEGGAPVQVELLERLLGGIDRQTFERIFAVGLKELQGLDILSQESIRGRLLSASAGLGATSIPSAMRNLDNKLENLLSQRGRQQKINRIISQLREIDIRIKELQEQAIKYAEHQQKRAKLEEQIKKNRTKLENIRQRLWRIEQLTKAREPWVRLCIARDKVAKLESFGCFPSNGLERFENLKKDIEEIDRSKREREDKIAHLEHQLSKLTVDKLLIEHQQDIETLAGEREKLITALDDLPVIRSKMHQAEEDFRRRLSELGTNWNAELLAQADTSVRVRQWVQDFGRRLSIAERTLEQAKAYQHTMQNAEAEAKRIADGAQRQLDTLPQPPIMDEQMLQKQQNAVRMMRPLFHKRDVLTAKLDAKCSALEDAEGRLASIQKQMDIHVKQIPSWVPITALMIGMALALMLAVQHLYAPAAIVLLVCIGLSGLLYMLYRHGVKTEGVRLSQLRSDKQQLEQLQRMLLDEISTLQGQVGSISKEIEQLVQDASIRQPNDVTQLEKLAGELEYAIEQLKEWKARKNKKDEAEISWHNAYAQLERAEQDLENAHQEYRRLQIEWKNWLTERGFADAVHPEGFEVILKAIENARVAEQNLQQFQDRIEQLDSYISEMSDRIVTLLDACGRKPLSDKVGVEDLDALRRDLDTARGMLQKRKELELQLKEIHSEVERMDRQLRVKQAECNELMQRTGAKDEEEFRRMAELYNEWCTYSKQVEKDELTLRAIAGTPEAQSALEIELTNSEPLQLQAEEDQLRQQLKELTDAISKDEREVGGLNERIAQMGQDRQLSELLLEQHILQEQLSDAIKQWAVLAVCRHLLGQACEIYERERQPQVIQEAGKFLDIMTSSRYRLLSPVGESSIYLEDAMLRRKEEAWSSGLADQVYLAIRLGLAREFSRHAEPLPIIFDDVLVRFDPARQLNATKVMLEFARKQQVLLFSHHPEIRDIVTELHKSNFCDVTVTYYTICDGMIDRA